jgi:hypothetical protein
MIRILKALALVIIAVCMSNGLLAQTERLRLNWEYNGIHWGVPEFTSVKQAVNYMTNEVRFLTANVPTFGSEHFLITTSTGATTDNWHVSCAASLLFSQFGNRESIPELIQLLDHDESYVRYAAYVLLQQKAGRYDRNYTFWSEKEKRQPSVDAWLEWWRKNKDNPSLDSPPKRVYEAKEWDKGNESTEKSGTVYPPKVHESPDL